MDFDDQLSAFYYLPSTYLQNVFSFIADDNVVQFISQLDEEKRQQALSIMKPEDLKAIESLLKQKLGTAGALMTTELIRVTTENTADEVIADMRLIGSQAETIYYIYVVNPNNQLTGVLSLRDLLLSPGDTKVKEIMNTQTVYVPQEMDQEEVARIIQEYDLLAVPVVNKDNILLGIVTVDDVLDVIHDEMTEDFHRFGGISSIEEEGPEGETVLQMTRKRLPWIIILIFLGLISANLISAFEDTLAQVVALAAFMPIILDSAGNVVTQSLAVSVRRLTLNEVNEESFWQMLVKEFGSGVLIGIASLVVDGPLIVLVDHHLAPVRLDHGAVRIGPGLTGLNGRCGAPGPGGQVRRSADGRHALGRSDRAGRRRRRAAGGRRRHRGRAEPGHQPAGAAD